MEEVIDRNPSGQLFLITGTVPVNNSITPYWPEVFGSINPYWPEQFGSINPYRPEPFKLIKSLWIGWKALKFWTPSKTSFPTMLHIKCLNSLHLSLPVWTCYEESQYVMQYQFVHDFSAILVPFFYLTKNALNKKS